MDDLHSERESLRYAPDDPGFWDNPDGAEEVERVLNESFPGGEWLGWRTGTAGVPGVAIFARLTRQDAGYMLKPNARPPRAVLTGLLMLGDAITADQLRKVPVAALENASELTSESAIEQVETETQDLAPLVRTAEMPPEEFSALVAEHYKVWDRYVPNAAAAIAAKWGVKPPTVHSWIREARLRGLLPPAKRGKR